MSVSSQGFRGNDGGGGGDPFRRNNNNWKDNWRSTEGNKPKKNGKNLFDLKKTFLRSKLNIYLPKFSSPNQFAFSL